MKKAMLILSMTLFIIQSGRTQDTPFSFDREALIPAYPLEVGWDKTTVLVFPAAVESADRGSKHILTQRDKKASNVLKLKAGKREFSESNLHVITADGRLYHFTVNYREDPACQTIDIGKQLRAEKNRILFKAMCLNPQQVKDRAQAIAVKEAFLKKREKGYGLQFQLLGVYIVEDVLFFQLRLLNRSRIDYRIDQLRFTVQDRKVVKRTTVRQEEKEPLYTWFEKGKGVAGRQLNTLVVAFEKFTVADQKEFRMQVLEKSGDRNLTLRIKGRDILQARPVLNTNFK